jgi:hypothetical protein
MQAQRRLEAPREYEQPLRAIGSDGVPTINKEFVMIKLGKVSVETRGDKGELPEEIETVPFTQM